MAVLGRLMLSANSLMSAVGNHISRFQDVTELMAREGIPAPQLMLAAAIAFLIAGSLAIIVE